MNSATQQQHSRWHLEDNNTMECNRVEEIVSPTRRARRTQLLLQVSLRTHAHRKRYSLYQAVPFLHIHRIMRRKYVTKVVCDI